MLERVPKLQQKVKKVGNIKRCVDFYKVSEDSFTLSPMGRWLRKQLFEDIPSMFKLSLF